MRISDWSSDVCSSDLLAADQRGGERRAPDRAAQLRPQMRHCADVVLVAMGQQQAVQPVAMPEIGRASCRERVCQYVSISVVAASLKKQHIVKQRTCGTQNDVMIQPISTDYNYD